jgi:Flp pilus assembly protein TadB
MANNTTEPTNQDIMDKLHRIQLELQGSEGRDRVMAWISLMTVGATVVVTSLAPQGWWAVLGIALLIIGGLGVGYRWSPW